MGSPQNPVQGKQIELLGELPIESLIVGKFPFADVRRYGSLNDAVTAIGGSELKTLIIATQTYVTANLTVPANINIQVLRGGRIYPGNFTLTINGAFSAPKVRVFYYTGTGGVIFGGTNPDKIPVIWFNVTGDNSTNDTAALNDANEALNVSRATEPQKTLCFHPGTYLITPGGLGRFYCNIYGPEAVFKAVTDTTGHVLWLQHRCRYGNVRIRGIIGSGCATLDVTDPVKDSNTVGLYVTDTIRTEIHIEQINGLKIGIHLNGYHGSENWPASTSRYHLGQLMFNKYGILMTCGDATPGKIEANRFYITYLVGNTVGVWCDGLQGATDYYICSNLFDIMVFEMHYDADEVGFQIQGDQCYENEFIVRGSLVPPTGTGKIVKFLSGANNNYFRFSYMDWSKIAHSTGYNIWDIETSRFGYPGAPDDGARSRIIEAAAPAAGPWRQGDICWNSAPAASGKIGWVCVTSGTPGTWKPFGAIDA